MHELEKDNRCSRTCRENIKKPDRKVFIKAEQDTWNY